MDYNSKCKTKSVKFLEDSIGENLGDLGFGSEILDIVSKSWSIKKLLTWILLN